MGVGNARLSGFQSARRTGLRASAVGALIAAAVVLCAPAPPASAVAKESLRPLDPAERGLVARLNDEREVTPGPGGAPLARLSVSSALIQAASDFAHYLKETQQFSHHAGGTTPAQRALAAGWTPAPGSRLSVGEDLFEGESPEAAYSAWKSSPSHAAVLFQPDAYWVGVGRSANKWVLLVGGRCEGPRCEATTAARDDAALVAAAPQPARLRFRLRRIGRRVVVGVRVLRGDGRVLVRLRRSDGRSARRTAVSRRGTLWRYRFRLPTRGRWRAIITFRPDPGWTKVLIRARPFTVRE